MRALAATISLALLAGCGSDDPSPAFGGFTPVDGTAVIFAPTTCNIPPLGLVSVSAVGIGFTDYSGACGVLTQTQFCGTRESSTTILGVAVSGLAGGGTVDPAGPGSYPFLRNPPTSNAFLAALGDAAEVGPLCDLVTDLDTTGGRIVLDAVSGTAVAGTVDVEFDDGSFFTHDFDVAVCEVTLDLCALFAGCYDPVCVPAGAAAVP